MLVLSRKCGEEILIGRDIRIKVIEVRGNRVRLGFTMPDEVSVMRSELCETYGEPHTRETVCPR